MNSIYLFTASDQKTILFPKTVFGVASALAGPVLLEGNVPHLTDILLRIPLVILWVWVNLLPFTIDNQRQPLSIIEDRLNKPWRPLPSGAISVKNAKRLMLLLYPTALVISLRLGSIAPCISLMILGYIYNDLGGADYSCIIRNVINAGGYTSFASGATIVASSPAVLSDKAVAWFFIIAMIVSMTVQMQDIPDQEGDRVRGRMTVPLVIGEGAARWTVALGTLFWALVAPTFWEVKVGAYVVPVALGSLVARRALLKSTVAEDKLTFKLWNLWMVSVYLLPLVKRLSE